MLSQLERTKKNSKGHTRVLFLLDLDFSYFSILLPAIMI